MRTRVGGTADVNSEFPWESRRSSWFRAPMPISFVRKIFAS